MKQALHCGIFVLRLRPLRLAGLGIAEPVAAAGGVADVVLVIQPDVEPDRRVERAVLVQAQPGQLVVEHLAVGLGEIAVLDPPIRDRAANAVDELAHRGLPLRRALLAVEILRHDHLGGQQRPGLGHLDVFLLENDLAGIVGDFRRPPFPLDLVEGIDLGIAEDPLDAERSSWPRQRRSLGARVPVTVADRRRPCGGASAKTCSLASIMVVPFYCCSAVCSRLT